MAVIFTPVYNPRALTASRVITDELHVVGEFEDNRVWLIEVPHPTNGIEVRYSGGSTLTEVADPALLSVGEYYVHYEGPWAGAVDFHADDNIEPMEFDYEGIGSPLPAHMIEEIHDAINDNLFDPTTPYTFSALQTFNAGLSTPSTTNGTANARFGSLEIQPYALNNVLIADNLYVNAGFRRRADGFVAGMQFINGATRFFRAPDGLASSGVFTESETMVLGADGYVGIGNGIGNPALARLHVGAGTTAPGFGTASKMVYIADSSTVDLLMRETGANVSGGIQVGTTAMVVRTTSNHPMYFYTNNTHRASISEAGVFIFGTGLVAGSATAGGFRASGSCQIDGATYLGGTSGNAVQILGHTSGNAPQLQTSSSNVLSIRGGSQGIVFKGNDGLTDLASFSNGGAMQFLVGGVYLGTDKPLSFGLDVSTNWYALGGTAGNVAYVYWLAQGDYRMRMWWDTSASAERYIAPAVDGVMGMGHNNYRWRDVWALTGVVNSSARHRKEADWSKPLSPTAGLNATLGLKVYDGHYKTSPSLKRWFPVLDEIPEVLRPDDSGENWVHENALYANTLAIQALHARIAELEAR